MRGIKFRVWSKEMYYDWGIDSGLGEAFYMKIMQHITKEVAKSNGYDLLDVPSWQKEIILMQYTGLKDKNGKEIYEGDILLYNNNSKSTVWYKNGAFVRSYKNSNVYLMYDSFINNGCLCDYEVIGNIYENPEVEEEK